MLPLIFHFFLSDGASDFMAPSELETERAEHKQPSSRARCPLPEVNEPVLRGGWWLVGNYDGVHLGHQQLISRRAPVSDGFHGQGGLNVLTFSPHPRAYFKPSTPPFRLTNDEEREALLLHYGARQVVTCPFTAAVAELEADAFIRHILKDWLQVDGVIIGEDFRFGAKRKGCAASLQEKMGTTCVDVSPMIYDAGAEVPCSSSGVRNALSSGDTRGAAQLLGRFWHVTGLVVRGRQDGRRLGFPTANIALGAYLRPRYGVYVVEVYCEGKALGFGVANIGCRPTLDGATELLEVHLFDFDGELYDRAVSVAFMHFLRPELTFKGAEALQAQIAADKNSARDWIITHKSGIQDYRSALSGILLSGSGDTESDGRQVPRG